MKNNLTVIFDSEKMYSSFIKAADMELFQTAVLGKSIKNICCENLLMVCSSRMKKLPAVCHFGEAMVILCSGGSLAVTEKQLHEFRFITCGYSSRDTVTLSSITSDKAVVSIQRGFYCADGTKVEPMELLISVNENTDEDMLAVTAALLYTGAWKKHRE